MTAAKVMTRRSDALRTCKGFDPVESAKRDDKHTLVVFPFDSTPIVLTARAVR